MVVVVGALATELVEWALNATIPLMMEWQPYKTVVATILKPHCSYFTQRIFLQGYSGGIMVVGFGYQTRFWLNSSRELGLQKYVED